MYETSVVEVKIKGQRSHTTFPNPKEWYEGSFDVSRATFITIDSQAYLLLYVSTETRLTGNPYTLKFADNPSEIIFEPDTVYFNYHQELQLVKVDLTRPPFHAHTIVPLKLFSGDLKKIEHDNTCTLLHLQNIQDHTTLSLAQEHVLMDGYVDLEPPDHGIHNRYLKASAHLAVADSENKRSSRGSPVIANCEGTFFLLGIIARDEPNLKQIYLTPVTRILSFYNAMKAGDHRALPERSRFRQVACPVPTYACQALQHDNVLENLKCPGGLKVTSIPENSPSVKHLKKGDIIIRVNNYRVIGEYIDCKGKYIYWRAYWTMECRKTDALTVLRQIDTVYEHLELQVVRTDHPYDDSRVKLHYSGLHNTFVTVNGFECTEARISNQCKFSPCTRGTPDASIILTRIYSLTGDTASTSYDELVPRIGCEPWEELDTYAYITKVNGVDVNTPIELARQTDPLPIASLIYFYLTFSHADHPNPILFLVPFSKLARSRLASELSSKYKIEELRFPDEFYGQATKADDSVLSQPSSLKKETVTEEKLDQKHVDDEIGSNPLFALCKIQSISQSSRYDRYYYSRKTEDPKKCLRTAYPEQPKINLLQGNGILVKNKVGTIALLTLSSLFSAKTKRFQLMFDGGSEYTSCSIQRELRLLTGNLVLLEIQISSKSVFPDDIPEFTILESWPQEGKEVYIHFFDRFSLNESNKQPKNIKVRVEQSNSLQEFAMGARLTSITLKDASCNKASLGGYAYIKCNGGNQLIGLISEVNVSQQTLLLTTPCMIKRLLNVFNESGFEQAASLDLEYPELPIETQTFGGSDPARNKFFGYTPQAQKKGVVITCCHPDFISAIQKHDLLFGISISDKEKPEFIIDPKGNVQINSHSFNWRFLIHERYRGESVLLYLRRRGEVEASTKVMVLSREKADGSNFCDFYVEVELTKTRAELSRWTFLQPGEFIPYITINGIQLIAASMVGNKFPPNKLLREGPIYPEGRTTDPSVRHKLMYINQVLFCQADPQSSIAYRSYAGHYLISINEVIPRDPEHAYDLLARYNENDRIEIQVGDPNKWYAKEGHTIVIRKKSLQSNINSSISCFDKSKQPRNFCDEKEDTNDVVDVIQSLSPVEFKGDEPHQVAYDQLRYSVVCLSLIAENESPSPLIEKKSRWSGSGFFLEHQGNLVLFTAHHVVQGLQYLTIRFEDKQYIFSFDRKTLESYALTVVCGFDDISCIVFDREAPLFRELYRVARPLLLAKEYDEQTLFDIDALFVPGFHKTSSNRTYDNFSLILAKCVGFQEIHSYVGHQKGRKEEASLRLELSTRSGPGNSGSPVISNKTGKVLGVITSTSGKVGHTREHELRHATPLTMIHHLLDFITSAEQDRGLSIYNPPVLPILIAHGEKLAHPDESQKTSLVIAKVFDETLAKTVSGGEILRAVTIQGVYYEPRSGIFSTQCLPKANLSLHSLITQHCRVRDEVQLHLASEHSRESDKIVSYQLPDKANWIDTWPWFLYPSIKQAKPLWSMLSGLIIAERGSKQFNLAEFNTKLVYIVDILPVWRGWLAGRLGSYQGFEIVSINECVVRSISEINEFYLGYPDEPSYRLELKRHSRTRAQTARQSIQDTLVIILPNIRRHSACLKEIHAFSTQHGLLEDRRFNHNLDADMMYRVVCPIIFAADDIFMSCLSFLNIKELVAVRRTAKRFQPALSQLWIMKLRSTPDPYPVLSSLPHVLKYIKAGDELGEILIAAAAVVAAIQSTGTGSFFKICLLNRVLYFAEQEARELTWAGQVVNSAFSKTCLDRLHSHGDSQWDSSELMHSASIIEIRRAVVLQAIALDLIAPIIPTHIDEIFLKDIGENPNPADTTVVTKWLILQGLENMIGDSSVPHPMTIHTVTSKAKNSEKISAALLYCLMGYSVDGDGSEGVLTACVVGMFEENALLYLLDLFLKAGADVDTREIRNETVLHCAASRGMANVVNYLARKTSEINAQNVYGHTALMVVALHADRDRYEDPAGVMRYLIQAGADINLRDEEDKTALDRVLDMTKGMKRSAMLELLNEDQDIEIRTENSSML